MRIARSVCLLGYLFLTGCNILRVSARAVDNTSYEQHEKVPFIHPKFHQEDENDKSIMSFFTGSFIEQPAASGTAEVNLEELNAKLDKGFEEIKTQLGPGTYTELPESVKEFKDHTNLDIAEKLKEIDKYTDQIKTLQVTPTQFDLQQPTIPADTTRHEKEHLTVEDIALDQLKFHEIIFTKEGLYLVGRLYSFDENKFKQPIVRNAEYTIEHMDEL